MKHSLALGQDNGYLFGEEALDLDLLIIYPDDWIANGAESWRYATFPKDDDFGLPLSSSWLRALCGLRGWKQLEIIFIRGQLPSMYRICAEMIQPLLDDFRSYSGQLDEDFTIWHKCDDEVNENITILRTKELGRYKHPQWSRADLGRLIEGRECVLGAPMADQDEGRRPGFHVQELHEHRRFRGNATMPNHCTACSKECQG